MVTGIGWPFAIAWASVPILAFLIALNSIRTGDALAGMRWLVLPAIAIVFLLPGALIGERTRFYLTRASYDRVVSEVAAGRCDNLLAPPWHSGVDGLECGKSGPIIFDWGGLGSVWYGVVYDPSDQIGKPVKERSGDWRQRTTGQMLGCSWAGASLGGHYYLASGSLGEDDCG